jgi:hypothetical protein
MTQHPITPPPELVQAWSDEALTASGMFEVKMKFATYAARWGADIELEACCEWLNYEDRGFWGCKLHTARRPKPPSLKEQALECLKNINDACESEGFSRSDDTDTIRRALEQLDD